MEVQENATTPQQNTNGIIIFSGPIMSAKKLGTIRPKTEDALRIVRR